MFGYLGVIIDPTIFMSHPKRASDEYIDFRKKITHKEKIKLIKSLCKEWVLTPQEVLDKVLCEGLAREDKRINQ